MDLRKLKTLIDLVQASGIAEIEINEEGDHVRIVNRPAQAAQAAPAIIEIPQAAPAPAAPAPSAALLLLLPLRPLTPRAVLR